MRSLHAFDLTIDLTRRAEYYQSGWWRSETIVNDFERACRRFPDKIAIIDYREDAIEPHKITFKELRRVVDRTADALLELSVQPGDVVSVQLPNWWEFTAIALATSQVGAIINPIMPVYRQHEVEFIIKLVQPKVVFAPYLFRDFEYNLMYRYIASAIHSPPSLVFVGDRSAPSDRSFEKYVLDRPWEQSNRRSWSNRMPEADQVSDILFTSGTTGEPKAVGHTHNTQFARARALYESLELTSSDSVFMPSPLAHSTGFVYGHLLPSMLGMTAVYLDVWQPGRALDIIAAQEPSWSFGSATFVLDLISAQRERGATGTSLRYFVSGGAAIPPVAVADCLDRLGARLVAVWGMTENGAATCTPRDAGSLAAAEDDGRPPPWVELKIVSPESQKSLSSGVAGRLLVRGASQTLGYARRPALTAACKDADGWFQTGDLGYLDDSGHLHITGREKDMIIRGGENIPVTELEGMLYAHPRISEIAIVGYPDERLGERACAVVVPTQGAQVMLSDIVSYLESLGVAKVYWPERLKLVPDLPRTMSGKIQKDKIRAELEM
jgi:cyclohexanecarboxylate-CoA ligase